MGNNDFMLEIYRLLQSSIKLKSLYEVINEKKTILDISNRSPDPGKASSGSPGKGHTATLWVRFVP